MVKSKFLVYTGAMKVIRIGTRSSKLALWQTMHTKELLEGAHQGLVCEVVPFVTEGDKSQAKGKPLPEIGGKGLFTLELEDALRDGRIDIAVHSLKDLPTEETPGLTLGAIYGRTEVRDMYLSDTCAFADLPQGSVIGTSSIRRQAQLLAKRPDLIVRPIRGNIDTRIRKMESGEYDAILLASAGVKRLGVTAKYIEMLPLEWMLPAPGQGALAVQCRQDDSETLHALKAIHDTPLAQEIAVERDFLAYLESGCSAPVGAFARTSGDGNELVLDALVASPDGTHLIRFEMHGSPDTLGMRSAEYAKQKGATQILASIHKKRGELPLKGMRVVITRPFEEAVEMATEVTRLGGEGIVAPTIAISPILPNPEFSKILSELQTFDWLIFTSTNAVKIFFDQYGSKPLPHDLKTAVVGPSTRRALEERGIIADAVPKNWDSEHIPDVLGVVDGLRILLPQALVAGKNLEQMLGARGALVKTVAIYETLEIGLTLETIQDILQGVDVVLFTSGSQVKGWMSQQNVTPELLAVFVRAVKGCIGSSTRKVLEEFGFTATLVGKTNTTDGLIEALTDYIAHPSYGTPTSPQTE